MPKISYLAKAKNGKDDTEVTALQIEQKIADIEALLRGMIDEDNMLCADDGTKIVPLSPSNVVDMPIETRPVQQCMKFFGYGTTHTTKIVDNLFYETIDIIENNPSFSVLNGVGDKEIVIIADGTRNDIRNSVSIEIPFNYTPMTWGDLWKYVLKYNPKIGISINTDGGDFEDKYTLFDLWSLGGFLLEFGAKQEEYVVETSLNMDETHVFDYFIDVSSEKNIMTATLQIYPKDPAAKEWLYRVVPSLLCRINP